MTPNDISGSKLTSIWERAAQSVRILEHLENIEPEARPATTGGEATQRKVARDTESPVLRQT